MEKMPFRIALAQTPEARVRRSIAPSSEAISSDWTLRLPHLAGDMVTLRELELHDAPALFAMLSSEEVARFISPPPTTVEGYERFITWTWQQRETGSYICYGVVPHGSSVAIGLFQIVRLDTNFSTAEWGFAIGSAYWGTGVFLDAGRLIVEFAFETLRVHRLEARAAVANGRGNGALRKIGAVQEGVLRESFARNGKYLDQALWCILDSEWRSRVVWGPKRHLH